MQSFKNNILRGGVKEYIFDDIDQNQKHSRVKHFQSKIF